MVGIVASFYSLPSKSDESISRWASIQAPDKVANGCLPSPGPRGS
jgi:hypothetical protein